MSTRKSELHDAITEALTREWPISGPREGPCIADAILADPRVLPLIEHGEVPSDVWSQATRIADHVACDLEWTGEKDASKYASVVAAVRANLRTPLIEGVGSEELAEQLIRQLRKIVRGHVFRDESVDQAIASAVRVALLCAGHTSETDARTIVLKHCRHVEQSPGVGEVEQRYALGVLADVLVDLSATPTEAKEPGGGASEGWKWLVTGASVYRVVGDDDKLVPPDSSEADEFSERAVVLWLRHDEEDGRPSGLVARQVLKRLAPLIEAPLRDLEELRRQMPPEWEHAALIDAIEAGYGPPAAPQEEPRPSSLPDQLREAIGAMIAVADPHEAGSEEGDEWMARANAVADALSRLPVEEPRQQNAEEDRAWAPYRWPQIEMRYEDGDWYARWQFSPFAMVDGGTREDAFAKLMETTPTLVMAIADLPRADVRDAAEVARAIAIGLEKRVEALEEIAAARAPSGKEG